MPIAPVEVQLYFTGATSALVAVSEIDLEYVEIPFEREEFKNKRLREAPTSTGAQPIIIQGFGGQPIQLSTNCTGDVVRPLGPDDVNLGTIYQLFQINRFTMRGAPSTASSVDALSALSETHRQLLTQFDAHQQYTNADVSVGELMGLQAYTPVALTTSGLTMSGPAFGDTTYTNCLITKFVADTSNVIYAPGSGYIILKSWQAEIEQRTIVSYISG